MTRTLVVLLLLTVIVATIGAGVAASRFQLAADSSSPYEPIVCVPDKETGDKIRAILFDATEQALKDHVVRMYEVWMRDERGQPGRATNGTRQGVKAFISGRNFLQKWDPPIC